MPPGVDAGARGRLGGIKLSVPVATVNGKCRERGLLLSLAGVLAQDLWLFVMSDAAAQAGGAVFALQGLVLLVAIALAVLARKATARGWIA